MNNTPDKQGEVLPLCPFCRASAFTSWDGDTDNPNDWSVNCDNTLECGATVGGMSSEAEAIKAWSRRASVAAVEGDALAAMFDELYNCYTASKCAAAEKGEQEDYHHLKGMADAYLDAARRCRIFPAQQRNDGTFATASSPAPAEPPTDKQLQSVADRVNAGVAQMDQSQKVGAATMQIELGGPLQPTGEQEK